MIIESSLLVKWFVVLVNRLTSWFGSGYFFKKGFKNRRWHYFLWAILISGAMFGMLYYFLKKY